MIDNVFIVIRMNNIGETTIESVWSTRDLAEAAINYHSFNSQIPETFYHIIERAINKTNANQP